MCREAVWGGAGHMRRHPPHHAVPCLSRPAPLCTCTVYGITTCPRSHARPHSQRPQDFRCRLVRDMSMYVRRMDAEQLEALCCASAVSGKCLTRCGGAGRGRG